jgi:hypothetical protein
MLNINLFYFYVLLNIYKMEPVKREFFFILRHVFRILETFII